MVEMTIVGFVLLSLVWTIAMGWVGCWVGAKKDMALAGFLLGFFLGPIGLVVIAVVQPSPEQRDRVARREGLVRCPRCRELIRSEASVCHHCRRHVVPEEPGIDESALDREWERLNRA